MATDLSRHAWPRTYSKQQNQYLTDMDDPNKKRLPKKQLTTDDLLKKIDTLEKQLQWEKLRADTFLLIRRLLKWVKWEEFNFRQLLNGLSLGKLTS